MTGTDLIEQMTKKCRRLAAAARDADDRAFWLGLVERWKAVESRSARQHCLRQRPPAEDVQKHSPLPGRSGSRSSPAHAERHSQPLSRLR